MINPQEFSKWQTFSILKMLSILGIILINFKSPFVAAAGLHSFLQTSQVLQEQAPSGVTRMVENYRQLYPNASTQASFDIDCSCPSNLHQCIQSHRERLYHLTAIIGSDCAVRKTRSEAARDGDFAAAKLVVEDRSRAQLQHIINAASFVGNCSTLVLNAHSLYPAM